MLGLALKFYVEVEVVPAPSLHIDTEGEGADLPTDSSHLAAVVVRSILGHDRVALTVRSSIPVSRGLGSSAAVAVATAPPSPAGSRSTPGSAASSSCPIATSRRRSPDP